MCTMRHGFSNSALTTVRAFAPACDGSSLMSAVTSVLSSAPAPRQAAAHGQRLAARAVEPRILLGTLRLADHERAGVGVGIGDALAELA